MTLGLRRWQDEGHDHFITCSCHERRPYFAEEEPKNIFLHHLEAVRRRYDLQLYGYVIMPEHVHLLLSEPKEITLASMLRVLKTQTSRALKRERDQFWQKRYYDFNFFSCDKRMEKIKYMHRNPVVRGLVERPEDYAWSSFRYYLAGGPSPVSVDRSWVEGWQRQPAHASR